MRIADEVDQHLLDLDAVGQHQIGRADRAGTDTAMPRFLRAHQRQRAGLLDQLGQVLDPALALAARDELAQPANDLPGAQRLVGRLGERIA